LYKVRKPFGVVGIHKCFSELSEQRVVKLRQ
jgi:hypothetical protein